MRRKRLSIIAAAICAFACTSSESVPKTNLLQEAEQLCLDSRFADAEPLLREHLRIDRTNAVAHYYLGRCYLSGDLNNLAMARGEISAALILFHDVGQTSPQARFTDEYFELMCLIDIGKTYLAELAFEIPRLEVPMAERVRAANDRIARCEALYERAKRVNPDADLTIWLRSRTDEAIADVTVR